jgi:hypothetical protein
MVDQERRRAGELTPLSASDIGKTMSLPINRTGIGSAFSDDEIALIISIRDEQHERWAKKSKKRSRPKRTAKSI